MSSKDFHMSNIQSIKPMSDNAVRDPPNSDLLKGVFLQILPWVNHQK